MTDEEMHSLIADAPSKSESIRRLFRAGVPKAAIATFMELRYQHVYNVLLKETPPHQEGAVASAEPGFTAVKVDAKGRVQLPPEFLTANGLQDGGTLFCRSDPRGLTLMTRDLALDHLREIARKRMPDQAGLLDALLDVAGSLETSRSRKDLL